MKNRKIIGLLALLWGLTALSCSNETDEVLDKVLAEVESTSLTKLSEDALRSVNPDQKGGSSTISNHKGQKGHDRRDGEDYIYRSNQGVDVSDKEIGYLYPVSHSHSFDQCSFQFFFGPIPLADVTKLYDHSKVKVKFFYDEFDYLPGLGVALAERELIYIYDVSSHLRCYKRSEYHVGDFITIPCIACECANSMEVYITTADGQSLFWRQDLNCPHQWYN